MSKVLANDVLKEIQIAMIYKNIKKWSILAKKAEINPRTLSRRIANPEAFTLNELIKITEVLYMKLKVTNNGR